MKAVAAIAVAWLLLGGAIGVISSRRGHWRKSWLVDALMGPFALIWVLGGRNWPRPPPRVLAVGGHRHGPVDLLIGVDGSPESVDAAEVALRLFGDRVGRATLAFVIDMDTARPHDTSVLHPEPWPEELDAVEQLRSISETLRTRHRLEPGSVVLAGAPADALMRYAQEEGFGIVVVGRRGSGMSKLLLGSCASKLAGETAVPVLLAASPQAG